MENPNANFTRILLLQKKLLSPDFEITYDEEKELEERMNTFKRFLAEYDIKLNTLKHIASQKPLIANDAVFDYFEIKKFVDALEVGINHIYEDYEVEKEYLVILKNVFNEVIKENDEENLDNPFVNAFLLFEDIVSANHNSATLYHGISDILQRKIPEVMLCNADKKTIAYMKEMGFEEKIDI